MPEQAVNSVLNTGVVGAVAIIFLAALWIIMNRRDEENKKHREELAIALLKKDEKLQTVMETTITNNTNAMHDNAEATRDNTKVLQNVKCLNFNPLNKTSG